jgi:hypothetical protein
MLSLVKYARKYALDGVDIGNSFHHNGNETCQMKNKDWEYPVANDRGGIPDDYNKINSLCEEIKGTFNNIGPGWQLTLTLPLPASYWYLEISTIRASSGT